jgi:hypothetical protein
MMPSEAADAAGVSRQLVLLWTKDIGWSAARSAGPTPGMSSRRLLSSFERCHCSIFLSNSRIAFNARS